jgi:hypothetical protein
MAGCFPEKLRQYLNEYICQRNKVASVLNSLEYWILRYKRSYLLVSVKDDYNVTTTLSFL